MTDNQKERERERHMQGWSAVDWLHALTHSTHAVNTRSKCHVDEIPCFSIFKHTLLFYSLEELEEN